MFYKYLFYISSLTLFSSKVAALSSFFTEGSLLYWQAQEGGLSGVIKSSSPFQLTSHSSVKNPKFQWDVGFRLGVGYRFLANEDELVLRFTSLQTHTDQINEAKKEEALFPCWSLKDGMFFNDVNKSQMHWRLHLGVLDLGLARSFYLIEHVKLKPQIGLSTAWIRQKYSVGYQSENGLPDSEEEIRMKNKFWGIGPLFGMGIDWEMKRKVVLFGQLLARAFCGQFYLHQDEDLLRSQNKLLGVHHIFNLATTALETTVGLSWTHIFIRSMKQLKISIALDQLLFSSQNQFMHFVEPQAKGIFISNQSDLSIRGIEGSFRFDF